MSRALPEPEENKASVSSSTVSSGQVDRKHSSSGADRPSGSSGWGTTTPSSVGESRSSAAALAQLQKKKPHRSPTEQTGAVEAEPSREAGDRILTTSTSGLAGLATESSVRTSSAEVAKNSGVTVELHARLNSPLENNSPSEGGETLDLAPDSDAQTSGESATNREAMPPVNEMSPANNEGAASSGGDLASFPARNGSEQAQAPPPSGSFQNVEHLSQTRTNSISTMAAPAPQAVLTPAKAPVEPRRQPPQPHMAAAFATGPLSAVAPSSERQKNIPPPTLAPTLAPSASSGLGAAVTVSLPNPVPPRAPLSAASHGFSAAGAQAAATFANAAAPSGTRGALITPKRPGAPMVQAKTPTRAVHVSLSSAVAPASSANPAAAVPVAPAGAKVAGAPLAAAPRLNALHSSGAPAVAAPVPSASAAGPMAPAPARVAPPPTTPANVVLVAPSTVAAPSPVSGPAAPLVPSETVSSSAATSAAARASPASTSSATSSGSQPGGSSSQCVGRWTREEHEAFLDGLKVFGREWKKVATRIPTRTSAQIRSHAQKYFARLAREERQHRAAAAAAAVAAQQPVGLAASSSSPAAGTGQMPSASSGAAASPNLPPSVMHNVERILADPAGVQREVERTLGALRERYQQLQERLDEQQRTRRMQAAAAAARQQRRPPQPPRGGRDPRAGGKMLLALSAAAAAGPQQPPQQQQQQLQQQPPGPGDVSLSGRKRSAADVVVEMSAAPASSSAAAPAAATQSSGGGGGGSSSCLEIRSAELIALQVLGGTLPRSGSRDPLNRPSPGAAAGSLEGPAPPDGMGSSPSGGVAAADGLGPGGAAGSSSPSSVASIDSSNEMNDDGGSEERQGDPKRQRTSD